MSMRGFIFFHFSLIFLFFLFHPFVFASNAKPLISLPEITVINPIRGSELGHEKDDLAGSLKAQWTVTHNAGINATWLWQYSALDNNDLTSFAKSTMKNQEFGLFFEIDRNLAKKSSVQYRGQGPWYFSDGLFLFSYDVAERKKIIDTVFAKFKTVFGYYPKTVGAWWIDADSLTYMQKKYGITSSLRAADQFNLDVYTIWGTPWSIPYLASQENAGIPAESFDNSSHVVMMQWAPRDPTQGYIDSTYSLQDYELKNYTTSYFDYLSSIYLHQSLDQIIIGLENGDAPSVYEGHYKTVLLEAKRLQQAKKATIVLAKNYADAFLSKEHVFPSTHYFLTRDFKTNNQSFWYLSPNYRIGIQKINNVVYLIDLRDYTQKTTEAFSVLPNSQGFLTIDEPGVIDSAFSPSQRLILAKTDKDLQIKKQGDGVVLMEGSKYIAFFTTKTFHFYTLGTSFHHIQQPFILTNINMFWILFFLFIFFVLYLYFYTKHINKTLLYSLPLFLSIVTAYPFLSTGHINNLTFLFDKKELIFFHLLSIPFLPIPFRILFVLQLLPFLLLLFFCYLFTIRLNNNISRILYFIYWGCLLLLFAHIPYFPLDRSTYKLVFFVFGGSLLLLLFVSIFHFLRVKSKRVFFLYLISIPFIYTILIGILFISRSKLIVTPFEIDALEVIAHEQRDVLYIFPTSKLIYKAVHPVLYDDYHFGEDVTMTHWEKVVRGKNNLLRLSTYMNKLIMIPRYLGADFSDKEAESFGLQKIFDNGQIAIFKQK